MLMVKEDSHQCMKLIVYIIKMNSIPPNSVLVFEVELISFS